MDLDFILFGKGRHNMQTTYYKEYSTNLGRDMEFKVYGHGGKPCIVFPCQNGRFFDFESFDMTNIAAP